MVLDIATADIDLDDTSEIFILADDGEVVEMSWNGSFARGASRDLGYSSDPDRITLADFDGDSPKAYLEGDSEKCEGNVLPMMVMIPPPFDRDHSDGDGSVGYGSSESTSESYSDTVSLGLGVDVGVGGSFFDLFSANNSTRWAGAPRPPTERMSPTA